MTNGSELMDKALHMKRKSGAMKAAYMMQKEGISYELAMLALVGFSRCRDYYGFEWVHWSTERSWKKNA